jgi:hypothetical protein
MRVATTARHVTSGGVTNSAQFGISVGDETHIMTILRDTLYTDRILAVLREYSANAWDAHRSSGKADVPIKVTLPTDTDPILYIRDFGTGMSPEDVFNIYSQYGASTKRGDNVAVGMMGIGSKSGFAYSDTFTVVSWYGGMKRIYVAVLDETDSGTINLLGEEPCGDEVGIEIQVPVKRRDIWEFQHKASSLFKYFTPRPEINIELPVDNRNIRLEDGFINGFGYSGNGWVAIMGCIPYRINPEQIREELEAANLWNSVSKMSGGLYFNIGDTQVSASREELKYSDKTKKALLDKFWLVVQEYTETIIKELTNPTLNPWDKRMLGLGLQANLQGAQLPLPLHSAEYLKSEVYLRAIDDKGEPCSPQTFTILNRKNEQVERLHLEASVSLIIKDDHRQLWGFSLPDAPYYLIRPFKNAPLDAVRKELDAILERATLTGIPITNISSYTWDSFRAARGSGAVNKKHLVRHFKFTGEPRYSPPSDSWESAEWEPSEDDVFVLINRFRVTQYAGSFFNDYSKDKILANALGFPMPEVYAYKTTDTKPVAKSSCKGTPYDEWRKSILKYADTPKVRRALKVWMYVQAIKKMESYRMQSAEEWERTYANLTAALGKKHPIACLIHKGLRAKLAVAGMPPELKDALPILAENLKVSSPAMDVLVKYPLIRISYDGIKVLWGDQAKYWLDYIRLVDASGLVAESSK